MRDDVRAHSSPILCRMPLPDSEIALAPPYPEHRREMSRWRTLAAESMSCWLLSLYPYLQSDESIVHGEVLRGKIGPDGRLVPLFELAFTVPARW